MRQISLQRFVLLSLMLQMTCAMSAQQNPIPAAPGRLVDLGGYQVHISCVGHGSPPVILLHGLGDYSFDWALVQPAIAANTETCAYDRPAQAWSDPGPSPRGVRTSARELHLLLQRSKIKGPYVLVGHSWGGLIARMYASEYPKEVAGMVLVDSTHEDEYLWINGKIIRPRFMTDEEWAELTQPKKVAAPASSSDSANPPAAPANPRPIRLQPPYDKLPPEAQSLQVWAMSQPRTKKLFEGGDTVDMRRDFIDVYKIRNQSEHPLGGIPLIVLSKTPGIDDDDDYKPEQLAWNRDLQNQLEELSTNSEHIVAEHSGHAIQIEAPEIVIASILRVIDAVKHSRLLKDEPAGTQ